MMQPKSIWMKNKETFWKMLKRFSNFQRNFWSKYLHFVACVSGPSSQSCLVWFLFQLSRNFAIPRYGCEWVLHRACSTILMISAYHCNVAITQYNGVGQELLWEGLSLVKTTEVYAEGEKVDENKENKGNDFETGAWDTMQMSGTTMRPIYIIFHNTFQALPEVSVSHFPTPWKQVWRVSDNSLQS